MPRLLWLSLWLWVFGSSMELKGSKVSLMNMKLKSYIYSNHFPISNYSTNIQPFTNRKRRKKEEKSFLEMKSKTIPKTVRWFKSKRIIAKLSVEQKIYKHEFMDQSKYVSIIFANTNLIGDYIRKFQSNNCMKFDEMEVKYIITLLLLSFLL